MLLKLSSPGTHEFWELPILYEDEHLLALDKPAGLLTVADSGEPDRPNLLELLHKGIADGKSWVTDRALSYLMNAYRLDAEASGVLLLAKNKTVLTSLSDLFGSEHPGLSFVTLVKGSPSDSRFSVDAKLAPHPVTTELMRVNLQDGKRARSDFEVVERFSGWTLLKCVPLTHRRHQLRAHLAYAGFPAAGDRPYRGKSLLLSRLKPGYHLKPNHTERPLIGSPLFHADCLTLDHPVTHNRLVINAPWPKDLLVALKYLRKWASSVT